MRRLLSYQQPARTENCLGVPVAKALFSVKLQYAVLIKAKQPAVDLHVIEADERQVERTKLIVGRIWRSIQAGHFYPNPSPMNCPTCPYREPCRHWTG